MHSRHTRRLQNSIWMLPALFGMSVLVCAAGGQRRALYQCQLVRGVCEDFHWTHPEESFPAGPRLHRGATEAGGWKREAGEAAHTDAPVFRKQRPHVLAHLATRMFIKTFAVFEEFFVVVFFPFFFFMKVSGANVFSQPAHGHAVTMTAAI